MALHMKVYCHIVYILLHLALLGCTWPLCTVPLCHKSSFITTIYCMFNIFLHLCHLKMELSWFHFRALALLMPGRK